MTDYDLARRRLHSQRLSNPSFAKAQDVVSWLGAVQAQDYAAAKWAVGLRMKDATESSIEEAIIDGSILRLHVLRPTWHYVAPKDIRWMLKLSAPRVNAASAYIIRQVGLDAPTFKKSNAVITKALRDGQQMTRAEIKVVLQKAGLKAIDLRLTYLVMRAELDGIICSGARRRGKQITYALLEERVPPVKKMERDESLAELVKRYFISRGPATLKDFVWWSGLTGADAESGLNMVKSALVREVIGEKTYWMSDQTPVKKDAAISTWLLPNYDEYTVAYADRTAIYDPSHNLKLDGRENVLFQNAISINGESLGTWKRSLKKSEVTIELNPFIPLTKEQKISVAEAANRYGEFLGLTVALKYS